MPEKVGRVPGNAHDIEICGCADDDSSAYRDLARDQRRIGERAHPKRCVKTGCYRVDASVFKNQIDLESRIFGEGIGIAVKRGNDTLRQAFNWALFRVWEKGKFAELWLRYFPINPY